MKHSKWLLCIFAFTLQCAIAASAAGGTGLRFTYALEHVPGSIQTVPSGINNAGVVVGTYSKLVDGRVINDAYILDGKKLTNLDDPKAKGQGETFPRGLNSLNPDGSFSVVGYYVAKTGFVGFLYNNGTYTDITGPRGAIFSFPFGINDSGAIVGLYPGSDAVEHGFLLQNGTYTTLDVPGAVSTQAFAINNSGDIVLNWVDANGNSNSSLYNGTTFMTITFPGAIWSETTGISEAGDVCYQWTDAIGVYHGALLHEGKYYHFDVPTHGGTWAYGMNDIGNIVGSGTYDGAPIGFKATYTTQQ